MRECDDRFGGIKNFGTMMGKRGWMINDQRGGEDVFVEEEGEEGVRK